jgi:hypothetical protein
MKNKFVTAVTTAGLLAGILGSAFVPSVKAAAGVVEWTMGADAAKDAIQPAGFVAATEEGTVALPMIIAADTAENLTLDASNFKDEFGTLITSGTISISASGSVKMADSVALYNTAKTSGSLAWAGVDKVLTVIETSATVTGAGSVTLSLGGASKTIHYTVVGALASITLTNGDAFTHLSAGKAGTANKLTYVERDSAGTTLAKSATANVTYSKDGATAGAIGAAADTTAGVYVNAGANAGELTIAAGSCAAADAGKTRTIAIKIGTVTSNTISFVCTLDGDSAVLTGAALDDTTLYAGGTAKVVYSFTDGTRQLGFGAVVGTIAVTATDFPNTFAGADSTKSAMGTFAATGLVVDKSGKATSAAAVVTANAKVAVGNRQVKLAIADANLKTAEAQAAAFTLKYSIIDEMDEEFEASISKSRFTVTADFGVAFKGKKISIVVENVATGSVVTYARKANSLGKVSYTIGRRGTFEIYAMSGDALTDTVVVKR